MQIFHASPLKKLNVIAHFIRHKDLADQHQTTDDITYRHPAVGKDNAGMGEALSVQTEEIVVLSKDNTALGSGKREMVQSLSLVSPASLAPSARQLLRIAVNRASPREATCSSM